MVNKKNKSSSKRVTLSKKNKIMKKLKEHHRKKVNEAKKVGPTKKSKVEKDPNNDRPFTEQELKAIEARRSRATEERQQKNAERKETSRKRSFGMLEDGLAEAAAAKEDSFVERKGSYEVGIGKNRDTSDRPFYKELVKVIEESDVILEVLDARDPIGTRCVDMERMVMKSGPNKHLVLLLNKIDLVPREALEKWLKYLREELPTVAFKCSTQEQRSNLGWKSSKPAKTSNLLQTSDCLGAETLIKLLKNYSRSHEIKKSITVGVIGLPNVGKSSLINSLKRNHVVNVGSTPGLTRSMQEVHLDKNVKLLDCPGVVMIKSGANDASIALRNCKRIEKLDDPVGPVKEILSLCPSRVLASLYNISSFESVDDFLYKVATDRGKLKKGGIVDVEVAARMVLRDWNEGKIPYFTMPPTRNQGEPEEAKIITELGKEFNIDEVYNGESSFIGSLKSVDDFQPVEEPSSQPLNFDENMLEDDRQPGPDNEGVKQHGEIAADVGDETMGSEDDVDKTKVKASASRQNERLYAEEGMLNTKVKRAEKKRRKKEKLSGADDMDGDYDVKVDDTKRRSLSGDEMDDDGNDEQPFGQVPMSGVNFDLLDE